MIKGPVPFLELKQKLDQLIIFFAGKGLFKTVIAENDVNEGQKIEIQEECDKSQKLVNKLVFSEQELDDEDEEHVCDELSHPCPKGHVDVDEILFLSSFDHFRLKNASGRNLESNLKIILIMTLSKS